jgi:glucose/arabinose dehydrogenase
MFMPQRCSSVASSVTGVGSASRFERRGSAFGAVARTVPAALMVLAAAGGVLGVHATASAQSITTQRVASGLSRPVFVTAPKGDFRRAFIVEQRSSTTGRIRILNLPGNTLNATPFLGISPVSTGSEQGLLGLAFHPNFLSNGYFFVNFTDAAGTTRIIRYRANAPFATSTTADATSATTILTIAQPFANHNGGWMGFRPDDTQGLLYIASGDGGSGNDPNNNAQNTSSLLGKMLRIDIDGPDNIPGNSDDDGFPADANRLYTIPASNPFAGSIPGADEILHLGLRNPWRPSFDRATGDLYIADVGQSAREEVNFVPANDPTTTARNFGWRCMEGTLCTGLSGCTCNAPALTMPVWEYSHSVGCSITGGYVYRGCLIPSLRGQYFASDYCNSQIWTFAYSGSGTVPEANVVDRAAELAPPDPLNLNSISSFGEDADGELYICDLNGGEVFKVVAAGRVVPDCNANGIDDALEICRGTVQDCNNDGIPDSCVSAAPSINTQPTAATVCSGTTAMFSVAAAGFGSITYAWETQPAVGGAFAPLASGTVPGVGSVVVSANTLTINSVELAANGRVFRAVVTNPCGSTTSAAVALTVNTCVTPCNPADIANNASNPGADGCVDNGDFSLFISQFFNTPIQAGCTGATIPCAAADIADNGSNPGADGLLDNGDFSLFISSFFSADCSTTCVP